MNLALLLLFNAALAGASTQVEQFVRSPTSETALKLREDCMFQRIEASALTPHLERIRRHPHALTTRLLLVAAESCAHEDVRREFIGVLGTELLFRRPAMVLEALLREHAKDSTLEAIARTAGRMEENPFVDCGRKCQDAVDPFFNRKRDALKGVSLGEQELRSLRVKLLEQVEKARVYWRTRLKGDAE